MIKKQALNQKHLELKFLPQAWNFFKMAQTAVLPTCKAIYKIINWECRYQNETYFLVIFDFWDYFLINVLLNGKFIEILFDNENGSQKFNNFFISINEAIFMTVEIESF